MHGFSQAVSFRDAWMKLESLQEHFPPPQHVCYMRGMWLSIKSILSAAQPRNSPEPPGCSYWLQSRLAFPEGIYASGLNGRRRRQGQFNHKQASHWSEAKMLYSEEECVCLQSACLLWKDLSMEIIHMLHICSRSRNALTDSSCSEQCGASQSEYERYRADEFWWHFTSNTKSQTLPRQWAHSSLLLSQSQTWGLSFHRGRNWLIPVLAHLLTVV